VRTLAERLRDCLGSGEEKALRQISRGEPVDRRDRLATLLAYYEVELGPIPAGVGEGRLARHPRVGELVWRLESQWLAELALDAPPTRLLEMSTTGAGVVAAMRALAARDRLPPAYRWLAEQASWAEVVDFLAREGGPDAGFDDLVARAQVGLSGGPKLELARNYWDEMGGGHLADVHTRLHEDLVQAIGMPRIPLDAQPESALARAALGGLLATNRWLQPELLGALGLVELQAGPRCRMVLRAFDRCGAPAGAYPFYQVHAEVDPKHGKDWLEGAIGPLADAHPDFAGRMLTGAWWRARTNAEFFATCAPAVRRAA
jgi:hypothetical protein